MGNDPIIAELLTKYENNPKLQCYVSVVADDLLPQVGGAPQRDVIISVTVKQSVYDKLTANGAE